MFGRWLSNLRKRFQRLLPVGFNFKLLFGLYLFKRYLRPILF